MSIPRAIQFTKESEKKAVIGSVRTHSDGFASGALVVHDTESRGGPEAEDEEEEIERPRRRDYSHMIALHSCVPHLLGSTQRRSANFDAGLLMLQEKLRMLELDCVRRQASAVPDE